MDTQAEQAKEQADILSTLAELNRGKFLITCSRQLRRVIEAILSTGKKGKVTIALDMVPGVVTQGRATQIDITPTVKIEEPMPSQGTSIFFVTADNDLTRDDPEQMAMFEEKEQTNRGA